MSATGHYDPSLLSAAPKLTKQQIQEGYSTALLDAPIRTSSTPSPFMPARMTTDPEAVLVPKEEPARIPSTKPVPFIKTRKGLIIIFFAVLAVIAIVVGTAVGTTVHKNNGGSGGGSSTTTTPLGGIPQSTTPLGGIPQTTRTSTATAADPAPTTKTPPQSAPPLDPPVSLSSTVVVAPTPAIPPSFGVGV